jgi:predicted ATP-grasp superfamily ATP-dependent carboligase
MEPSEQYRIITNTSAYAESMRKKYPDYVFLVGRKTGDESLDTYALLAHPKTAQIIAASSTSAKPSIIVFKNTSRIEALCAEKKWKLLNPPAALAEKIENKISQVEWLGEAARYLPPHTICKVSEISTISAAADKENTSLKKPFIIQWAHSHTGNGTMLIPSGKPGENGDKILTELKRKFPDRECRVTGYIRGPMFTANVINNTSGKILIGNVSYQITGMLPFTDNPFATIGNDWSLPHSLLSEKKLTEFNEIAVAVGQNMLTYGWIGLLGIDCIYDEERDTIHLIEVNARQPASVTYESELQGKVRGDTAGDTDVSAGMTIFEAHIAALTGQKLTSFIEINDGAQIIDRIKNTTGETGEIGKITENLRHKRYTVIEYENKKPGADHIRIQSERGIMSAHNAFNSRGKEIMATVML